MREAILEHHRLAYVSEAPVNWCPELGTVLANEEVIDGKSEVGGHPVERRPMRQWMLRITAYAQRLIDELDGLDWPESIKLLQRNWIGRSEGAEVQFGVAGSEEKITVFTTRPDTLYGATYMVLAPEHALVDRIVTEEQARAVEEYRERTARKSDLERTELSKDKTGVWIGAFAVNPVTIDRIPIWIADYVLLGYGTGAIMAVPAHDERDWEFARKYALPIREVVSTSPMLALSTGSSPCQAEPLECFVGDGYAIHSGPLDGMPTAEAKTEIIRQLTGRGLARKTINFKLRDWLFSRQRYWGEPFPIVWENGRHRALPDTHLPLNPPPLDDFKPTGTGEPPLAKATQWVRYSDKATRETNTMPQWAGSCWYYLRYCDSLNQNRFVGVDAERYWMTGKTTAPETGTKVRPGGVDLYVGGTEHAVLHLLYARFWHKVLFDLGYVSTPEPFQRLVNQGLIMGETQYYAFAPANGSTTGFISSEWAVDIQEIALVLTANDKRSENACWRCRSIRVTRRSKRGANTSTSKAAMSAWRLAHSRCPRAVAMSSTPTTSSRNMARMPCAAMRCSWGRWNRPSPGAWPASRAWRAFSPASGGWPWRKTRRGSGSCRPPSRMSHPTRRSSRSCMRPSRRWAKTSRSRSVSTSAISQMMIFVNAYTNANPRPRAALRPLLQVLNPFAPHLTEELWERLGFGENGARALATEPWPAFDEALLVEDEIEIVIQVNGKVRDKIVVKKEATREDVEAAARASAKIAEWTAGKEIKKVVVVPGRLVNIVDCGLSRKNLATCGLSWG